MNEERQGKLVIITAGGRNPQVLINALARRFPDLTVLVEPPESKSLFVRRRARKLGWITALGQLATMMSSRFGKRFTEARAAEILRDYGLSDAPDPAIRTIAIPSINSAEAIDVLRAERPDAILLVSCRMLSAATLSMMPCPVMNLHAGINPHYRGLMGGYWSRICSDEGNFGTTIHLVDAGVDTGGVLYQARVKPLRSDTMHTYPLLLTAAGTDIAGRAVEDALAGRLTPISVSGTSRQWYHPPIWTYLWNGMRRGIW